MGVVLKRIAFAIAALALVLWLMPKEHVPPQREDRLALSTLVTLKLYGQEQEVEPLFEEAYGEFALVDSLMSRYREDSELAFIERRAGKEPTPCGPELLAVLRRSNTGLSSPTGHLIRRWGR